MSIFGAFLIKQFTIIILSFILYMQTDKTVAQSIVNGLPSNFLENMTTIPGFQI